MVKKIKTNIKKQLVTKSVYSDLFTDQRTRLSTRLNEESIMNLGMDIIKWIREDDDVLTFEEIYVRLGILPSEFQRLRDKYQKLDDAAQFCMVLLSVRRHKGGMIGKYNASMVNFTQPMYNQEWKKHVEWRAGLQAKNNDGYQTINVQMAPIPNSDLVPMKKSESLTVEKDLND